MEKFYENSDFAIYTDKHNKLVDLYNKLINTKTRFMTDKLDEALVKTVSFETLIKLKQSIDVELNKRINNGDIE